MKTRVLGHTGEKLSAVGLGCMGMTGRYGPSVEKENLAVLERALALGVTLIDTADMYGDGANEMLISKFLAPHRQKVFLATKFGFVKKADGTMGVDCSPEYARRAVEASLKRLKTDRIDLYYAHRVDPDVPVEETVGAMGDLVREGKIRYVGICEASAASIRRAHREYPLAAVQSEYSVITRDVEAEVLPACRELGISLIPYSPLHRGLMSAAMPEVSSLDVADFRRTLPRFSGVQYENNLKLVAEFASIAQRKGCTPAQLALAWVLHRDDAIIPIPGTKRIAYLEENCGAPDVALDGKDMTAIDELVKRHPDIGQRYDNYNLSLVNR